MYDISIVILVYGINNYKKTYTCSPTPLKLQKSKILTPNPIDIHLPWPTSVLPLELPCLLALRSLKTDPTLRSLFMYPAPEEGEDQSEGVEDCEQYFYDL